MSQQEEFRLLTQHIGVPKMVPDVQKITENRLRAVARRQGLTLVKSKARDQRSELYNTYGLMKGNEIYAGPLGGYGLSLDQVEQRLGEAPAEAVRKFRAVDPTTNNVLGETDAIDGWAAIAWAERHVKRRPGKGLSALRIEEFIADDWRLFFESKVGLG